VWDTDVAIQANGRPTRKREARKWPVRSSQRSPCQTPDSKFRSSDEAAPWDPMVSALGRYADRLEATVSAIRAPRAPIGFGWPVVV
jgi:hypothetical protein